MLQQIRELKWPTQTQLDAGSRAAIEQSSAPTQSQLDAIPFASGLSFAARMAASRSR